MARFIRHDAQGPIEIPPQTTSVWVCACGLSQSLPFCDGSHDNTSGEKAGQVCVYDKSRTQVVEIKQEE